MESAIIKDCQKDAYSKDLMLLIQIKNQEHWVFPLDLARQLTLMLATNQRHFPMQIALCSSDVQMMKIHDIGKYPPRCTAKITKFYLNKESRAMYQEKTKSEQMEKLKQQLQKVTRDELCQNASDNQLIRRQKLSIEPTAARKYITIQDGLKLRQRTHFNIIAHVNKILFVNSQNLSLQIEDNSHTIKLVCFHKRAEKVKKVIKEGKSFEFEDVMWKHDKNRIIELELVGQVRSIEHGDSNGGHKQVLNSKAYSAKLVESRLMPVSVDKMLLNQSSNQSHSLQQKLNQHERYSQINIIDHATVKQHISFNKSLSNFAVRGIIKRLKVVNNNRTFHLFDHQNNYLHVTVWKQHSHIVLIQEQEYILSHMRLDRKNPYNNSISTNHHSTIVQTGNGIKKEPIKPNKQINQDIELVNKKTKRLVQVVAERMSIVIPPKEDGSQNSIDQLLQNIDKLEKDSQTEDV